MINRYNEKNLREKEESSSEAGQSIVLAALAFVVLLLFVGLAVDVGYSFVRSSEFSRSVDSAALAGVVDLDISSADCATNPLPATCPANIKAEQFLSANGWPISQATEFTGTYSFTQFGVPQYSLTVTYPVETYFMRLAGFGSIPVTHRASAAYFAQSDLLTPTNLDFGQVRVASQYLTGPDGCSDSGDPVIPLHSENDGGSLAPNADYAAFDGVYRYRIRVPSAYTSTTGTILVELFDPDSVNLAADTSPTITHSKAYSAATSTTSSTGSCSGNWGEPCIINTNEMNNAVNQNPVWLERVDETFNASCQLDLGQKNGDTETVFELYSINNAGGRDPIATYTHLTTDDHSKTDMKWVAPGVTAGVDVDGGSPGTFEVSFASLPDNGDEPRFIHLDVYANSGSSRNIWDVRAGPPSTHYEASGLPALPENVNDRNLVIANHAGSYLTNGVTVSAIGRLPLDHHVSDEAVSLIVSPIGDIREQAFAYLTVFDYIESDTPPPQVTFSIDSDISGTFLSVDGKVAEASPDGNDQVAFCDGGNNCDNAWTEPNWVLKLPNDPSQGFAGGNIIATYTPKGDAHTWWYTITAGRPFLTE